MERPLVIVHSLAQARSALAAALDLEARIALRSPLHAGHYAGALYFRKIVEALESEFGAQGEWTFLFDCDADAGLALNALRHGIKALVFSGGRSQAASLAAIARKQGATIRREAPRGRPPAALDLLDRPDPYAAVSRWLRTGDAEDAPAPPAGD